METNQKEIARLVGIIPSKAEFDNAKACKRRIEAGDGTPEDEAARAVFYKKIGQKENQMTSLKVLGHPDNRSGCPLLKIGSDDKSFMAMIAHSKLHVLDICTHA